MFFQLLRINIYLGERLFPERSLPDSIVIAKLVKSEPICIERVNDTVFAFYNNNLLNIYHNKYLPEINDSLLKFYYPRYYKIEVYDDVPYSVYLRNSKDFVSFTKDQKNGYYIWERSTVRDTILSFCGIKVGMNREKVFSLIGFPALDYKKDNFSLILCHASVPSKIWFKNIFKQKEVLESFGYIDVDIDTSTPNITILIHFKNGRIEYLYLDYWIGYGEKGLPS